MSSDSREVSREEVKREIKGLADISELTPGSLLLFRVNEKASLLQKAVRLAQSKGKKEEFADPATTHAAIYLGKEEEKEMVAHMMRRPFKDGGKESIQNRYVKETFARMLEFDGGSAKDRRFTAFAPKDPEFREKIIEVAKDKKNEKIKYNLGAALKAVGRAPVPGEFKNESNELSEQSYCTQFLIECYNLAGKKYKEQHPERAAAFDKAYPAIDPQITTVALYNIFYKNENMERHNYAGKDFYNQIYEAFGEQINKIREKNKYDAEQIGNAFAVYRDGIGERNVESAAKLLGDMEAVFADHGYQDEYQKVADFVHRAGIFKEDIPAARPPVAYTQRYHFHPPAPQDAQPKSNGAELIAQINATPLAEYQHWDKYAKLGLSKAADSDEIDAAYAVLSEALRGDKFTAMQNAYLDIQKEIDEEYAAGSQLSG